MSSNMLQVERLVWDRWNIAHIARHGVTQGEVVDACFGDPLVREAHDGRLLVIGPTRSGRMIAVVIEREPIAEEAVYYVVTARPAARQERRRYQEEKGGENI